MHRTLDEIGEMTLEEAGLEDVEETKEASDAESESPPSPNDTFLKNAEKLADLLEKSAEEGCGPPNHPAQEKGKHREGRPKMRRGHKPEAGTGVPPSKKEKGAPRPVDDEAEHPKGRRWNPDKMASASDEDVLVALATRGVDVTALVSPELQKNAAFMGGLRGAASAATKRMRSAGETGALKAMYGAGAAKKKLRGVASATRARGSQGLTYAKAHPKSTAAAGAGALALGGGGAYALHRRKKAEVGEEKEAAHGEQAFRRAMEFLRGPSVKGRLAAGAGKAKGTWAYRATAPRVRGAVSAAGAKGRAGVQYVREHPRSSAAVGGGGLLLGGGGAYALHRRKKAEFANEVEKEAGARSEKVLKLLLGEKGYAARSAARRAPGLFTGEGEVAASKKRYRKLLATRGGIAAGGMLAAGGAGYGGRKLYGRMKSKKAGRVSDALRRGLGAARSAGETGALRAMYGAEAAKKKLRGAAGAAGARGSQGLTYVKAHPKSTAAAGAGALALGGGGAYALHRRKKASAWSDTNTHVSTPTFKRNPEEEPFSVAAPSGREWDLVRSTEAAIRFTTRDAARGSRRAQLAQYFMHAKPYSDPTARELLAHGGQEKSAHAER